MSIKVNWAPSLETDIASYDLERASVSTGPYTLIANIVHVVPGANYDNVTGQFFYIDSAGTSASWYRLIAIDQANQRSVPSTPFQPVTPSSLPNVVAVDHNYGSPGALRYQTASGVPIENAIIRLYKKSDFDQGNTQAPLAVTLTNVQGNWVNPVSLQTGFTYVVQFHKEGLYGPDKVEILV